MRRPRSAGRTRPEASARPVGRHERPASATRRPGIGFSSPVVAFAADPAGVACRTRFAHRRISAPACPCPCPQAVASGARSGPALSSCMTAVKAASMCAVAVHHGGRCVRATPAAGWSMSATRSATGSALDALAAEAAKASGSRRDEASRTGAARCAAWRGLRHCDAGREPPASAAAAHIAMAGAMPHTVRLSSPAGLPCRHGSGARTSI